MSTFNKDAQTVLAETRSAFSPTISRRTLLKGAAASTLLATTGMSLAACGSSAPASGATSGTITIWDRSGDLFQVFDATIASFNKKYPNIKVNHVAVDVDTKIPSTLITGVNVPDGAFYEDNNLPALSDHYYDITDWIQPYVKDIVPFKVTVNTFGGRIKGIPFDLDPAVLYYRADLLEQAGIDPTKIATYDDLLTAAQTLQSKLGPKVKPIHMELDPGTSELWVNMFANQQNSAMVDSSGNLQLNTQPYLNIMNWLSQVSSKGLGSHVQIWSPDHIAALDNGQEIFFPYAIWGVYGLDLLVKKTRGKWRVMQLPAWTAGGSRAAVMGGSSFIIPKKAKNPHLAWLFYEYLMFSPEGYKAVFGPNKIYAQGINTLLPSYKPALATQLIGNVDALGGQDLWNVAVGTVPNISQNYIYPSWYNQSVQYFGANIQRLIEGQMTPAQVLATSTTQIQTKLINRS
jgi:lactose/L-arabinose transport system substrate-binding protein